MDKNTSEELKVLSPAQQTAVSGGLGVSFGEVYSGRGREIFNNAVSKRLNTSEVGKVTPRQVVEVKNAPLCQTLDPKDILEN